MTIERVLPHSSSVAVGVRQVQWLGQQRRAENSQALDVIVADGHYGSHRFFGPLRQERCALLARLRRDRVLYGPPSPYKGRGRRPKHSARFAFKQPESWPQPAEETAFEDEWWGQVRLRRWNNLHEKQDADTILAVLCAEVHRERDTLPRCFGWATNRATAITRCAMSGPGLRGAGRLNQAFGFAGRACSGHCLPCRKASGVILGPG
jgi:hypothetical protein